MFPGDEEEADAVDELQAAQGGHAHVQEHAQDDGRRDEPGAVWKRETTKATVLFAVVVETVR